MTQNERAKREKASETQALLQFLAIGEAQVLAGQMHSWENAIKIIRSRRSKLKVVATGNRNNSRKARALS